MKDKKQTMSDTPMKAWHFVNDTLRDGSPVPKDGEKLVFTGEPILCKQGYHASNSPFDALQYAPGNILCRVECGGTIIKDTDKFVCTERTIIKRMDVTGMLRYFARMQALSVIHLYPNGTDDVVFDFLMTGENANAAYAAAKATYATHAAYAVEAAAYATHAAKATHASAANAKAKAAHAAAKAAKAAYAYAKAAYATEAAAYAYANAARAAKAAKAAYAAAGNDFNQLVYETFEWVKP